MTKTTTLAGLMLLVALPIFAQLNISHESTTTYGPRLNDIWGYAADGNEYALVGLRTGVNILDITDPANPVDLGTATGPNSTWRDIKTYGEYAYITNENDDGILVIDLSNLPTPLVSADWSYWEPTITGLGTITDCHNIYIDESGYAYLAGCNVNAGGPIYVDVFTTPGTPVYVDKGPAIYAHDIYTRNDIMYTSDIFAGQFKIYDVSDKTDTQLQGAQTTPFDFTHNAWPNDAGNVLFTTDEKGNAPVAAYDISDPTDINLLDEFKPLSTLNTGVIPHNVHVLDDYLIISHYSDGVIIVDASEPDNMIEVGNYDTYTGGGTGFNGAWGAYPFLPSGNILVSDQNNGCFVLSPTYVRAARLEGTVTDASDGSNLFGVDISIDATQANEGTTDLSGEYKTGLATAGTYDVTYSKAGYDPVTVSVTLSNGTITVQNVALGLSSLDVELLSFQAKAQEQQTLLQWSALTDSRALEFLIERSTNAIDFTVIDRLNDTHPSIDAKAYEYLDRSVSAGKWFYRITIIEPDGQQTYSPIRVVEHQGQAPIRLFPNPVAQDQTIILEGIAPHSGTNTLSVYNHQGILVDQLLLSAEQDQWAYNRSALPAGVYLFRIEQNQQLLHTARMVLE